VPRHPQRFETVNQLLESNFDQTGRRSMSTNEQSFADLIVGNSIILGDTMGEMSLYYALSDIVIMGGSLQPLGGQNFIEACALGRPIILGEHTFNFQQASRDVIDANAAIRVFDVEDLVKAIDLLLSNQTIKENMGAHALDFANQHTGATEKILQVVQTIQKSQKS
jgi:3-deoxy-D-manno-octulosonic-acid transferase